uniref:Cyclopropane-fatty-acyl-phospholipid synthase-like protein, clusters with FIG005069 n=1 Tax=uncultured Thiotrichaceae bacterium TaxID=298394 RepID=A0A6S6UJB2_9GAMM|nr:MAG: Cyclopropane-fatty-acyl-phospholipid synthase-like protein, clusters with FIG005069 [uncultured Thiotrichaceae bacterium]
MTQTAQKVLNWTEQGYVPDTVVRHGIRRLLAQRLTEISSNDCERMAENQQDFVAAMREAPIAVVPEKANEQHYEVPADLFTAALGPHYKYSCCYWPEGVNTLAEAEHAALEQTCQRADLKDGQRVLELGCGWGSLTLWMAKHYPNSHITAVSNSASQREHIEAQAAEHKLTNLRIVTCDMNDFDTQHEFDRIVSIEMFEHMRNWETLYKKVSNWLTEDGKFFKHIFVHRATPYLFEDKEASDWMSRHFFSGGMMPSDDLPLYFQNDLNLLQQWRWQGQHYEKTCNAWLAEVDGQGEHVRKILADTYGEANTQTWWMRWRLFFMACAELFGYNDGQEWYVGHYLFAKRQDV